MTTLAKAHETGHEQKYSQFGQQQRHKGMAYSHRILKMKEYEHGMYKHADLMAHMMRRISTYIHY